MPSSSSASGRSAAKSCLVAAFLAAIVLVPGPLSTARAGTALQTRVVATIDVGRRPEPVVADAAHHRVYVGNESGATVSVIDDRTNAVLRVIPAAHEIEDMALDPSTGLLYTANRISRSVSVIDTTHLAVVATITPGGSPNGVALDPARRRLYVTLTAQGQVAVISTTSRRVVRMVRTPGDPQGIGVDSRTHRVFVALEKTSRLLAFDPSGWRLLASIPVSRHPVHPVRVDSVTHRVFTVGSLGSHLAVVNGRTLRIAANIATGANPEGIDLSPDGRFAYVANEGDPGTDKNSGKTVSVIDLRSRRVVDTAAVLQGPDGLAFDSAVGRLYVGDETVGKVSVVALPSQLR
jgi:YVTN family beta-propeller protein